MSSLGDSSESVRPADLFVDLWKQLGECHQNAVQDLEAKVSKLKKDRCLDAQRLEVFYNRNHQLKEQNQTLQNTICILEERLRAGECNRCAVFEDNLKTNQEQNLHMINKLKNERNRLEDENRKLQAEVQKLKSSHPASSPEQEDGVIPDSPILSSSLPVSNKLRKRKHADRVKHVRYAEMSLPQGTTSLFYESKKEPAGDASNPGKIEVLVPNTCQLDASQMSNDVDEELEGVIAETCGFQLGNYCIKKDMAQNQPSDLKSTWKQKLFLKPYSCSSSSSLIPSPDSTTERSPSVLPHAKRFLEGGSVCSSKRKKEESDSQVQKCSEAGIQEVDKQKEGKHAQPELIVQTSTSVCNRSFKKPPDNKTQLANGENSKASCISPDFKKPQSKAKEETDVKKRTPLQDLNVSHKQPEPKDGDRKHAVESAWSIDPALTLSMYESEQRDEDTEEQRRHGDLADTDCTWVSHSMLQRRGENRQDGGDVKSGLGQKANDSLDMMFDTTAHGEYKSQLDQSQPFEEDEEEEEHHHEQDPSENISCRKKSLQPTFKHMAVIRKKDERRKLKGSTCKECEVYYAHLPEEEKQQKLSACSRHRFLYVPPCTPENFWEVGFPSTQTCIERGYIKEEKNPETRSRRRQPFNALFSPKQNQQQT